MVYFSSPYNHRRDRCSLAVPIEIHYRQHCSCYRPTVMWTKQLHVSVQGHQ